VGSSEGLNGLPHRVSSRQAVPLNQDMPHATAKTGTQDTF
jgi:hypothetical protein